MNGNAFCMYAPNIVGDCVLVVSEIGSVRLFGIAVPFAGEDTLAADRLKAPPQASYAGKQIDKLEGWRLPTVRHAAHLECPKQVEDRLSWCSFPSLPSVNSAFSVACSSGRLWYREACLLAKRGKLGRWATLGHFLPSWQIPDIKQVPIEMFWVASWVSARASLISRVLRRGSGALVESDVNRAPSIVPGCRRGTDLDTSIALTLCKVSRKTNELERRIDGTLK